MQKEEAWEDRPAASKTIDGRLNDYLAPVCGLRTSSVCAEAAMIRSMKNKVQRLLWRSWNKPIHEQIRHLNKEKT